MNGKGSKKRPTNLKKFLKNWDDIDWSKPSTKKDKMEYLIKKTQHVADVMEAESKRQRDQDANAPESTAEGMVRAMKTLMAGYKGNRK